MSYIIRSGFISKNLYTLGLSNAIHKFLTILHHLYSSFEKKTQTSFPTDDVICDKKFNITVAGHICLDKDHHI
ncbi:hypothetical protein BpHYR1_015152 [Brachionus plicatilis]|uniref:Uncharacterized protein n=1 Tax=Brachionus plicatilis TaxID=10195 RepID=A0A3M7SRK3_BRAPC|nr:hypothetical protein BpHYR1_015152 [Brachionus plicatilis]